MAQTKSSERRQVGASVAADQGDPGADGDRRGDQHQIDRQAHESSQSKNADEKHGRPGLGLNRFQIRQDGLFIDDVAPALLHQKGNEKSRSDEEGHIGESFQHGRALVFGNEIPDPVIWIQRLLRIEELAIRHLSLEVGVASEIERLQRMTRVGDHGVDACAQRCRFLQLGGHFFASAAKVDREQTVEPLAHGVFGLRALDDQIHLGIDTHRAIAQIGRSDLDDAVIGDENLRVYINVFGFVAPIIRNLRAINAQPVVLIGCREHFEQAIAKHAHGALFKPSSGLLGKDDDDLGSL